MSANPLLVVLKADYVFSHISHHVLALWYLGAPPSIIQAAYDNEVKIQRPITYGATADMEPITEANFRNHVGEAK